MLNRIGNQSVIDEPLQLELSVYKRGVVGFIPTLNTLEDEKESNILDALHWAGILMTREIVIFWFMHLITEF